MLGSRSTDLSLSSCMFFFFKQKTAYELRISDWSSDVCSSDLRVLPYAAAGAALALAVGFYLALFGALPALQHRQIGRASCRESVSVRVDLGGRRIIKKTKQQKNSQMSIYNTTYNPRP